MVLLPLFFAALLGASPDPAGAAPDYSQAANWVCRPGSERTCTTGLDAVTDGPSGAKQTVTFAPADDPKIDCFYVYPTVSKEQTVHSDLVVSPEIADVANRQVGRLTSRCRMFAPVYRQLTLLGLREMMHGEIPPTDTDVAMQDVEAAWAYYLAHDNAGRGVVLIGHSQGTILLQRLIASTIDGTPQQKLLVSAFLAGDPSLAIPKGKKVGGTFAHVPVCSAIAQTGCAYAWGSYLEGDSSPLFTFGSPLDNGMISACVNPAAPSGGTGALKFFHANVANATGSGPPFVETLGALTGTCRFDSSTGNGFIVSVRAGPRAASYKALLKRYQIVSGWGLHIADLALVQGNILDVLDAEIATYTKSAAAYPAAPTSDTTETFFGTVVADPYRPLESLDAPATKAWIASENARTHAYLDAVPVRPKIATAFKKLLNFPQYSQPFREGTRYFYTFNPGLLTSARYYVRDSENGAARLFWDPNTLSKDGSIQATSTIFSKDGSLMAYSTSVGGEDWQTWHVKVVSTGRDTHDVIHWSKFSNASWDGDRGFYYAGYDTPARGKERTAAIGVQKVWFHRLGTPQTADRLVFASTAHPDRFVGVDLSYDQRYAFLYQEAGDTTMLSWKERAKPDAAFAPLTGFTKNISYSVIGNDGSKVYLYTNDGAPNFRIVSTDLYDPKHALHEVIPQRDEKLDSYSLIGDRFYLYYLHDAHAVVRIAKTSGAAIGEVALPGIGSGGLPGARREDRIAYYSFSSYALPTTIYRYDTVTGASRVYLKSKSAFDGSPFVTEQVFAISKDGTKVPVFITRRKDVALDGTAPTLIYGYGGFNVSETPYFSADRALWLQMGGIYADVVLRGGGEYGDPWHDAGRLARKQNVFDDFAAAAQYLIDHKYTSTPKLAMDGGSNGGLLVGAELTQHPTLFGAAIAEQGVLDMLRFDKFTVGKAWIPEYGSATASKEQFDWLDAYSPLQNVKPGTSYPATLITTADHDDRVFPAHSLKFAAALQAAQAGSAPILLRVQTNEGHFSGLTTDESIALYADFYAFLAKTLDFEPTL